MVKTKEMAETRKDFICSRLRHGIELLKCLLKDFEKETPPEDDYVEEIVKQLQKDLKELRRLAYL